MSHIYFMAERAPQAKDKFIIRLPDGMRDRISKEAEANKRSMTAEIVARLEASFDNKAGVYQVEQDRLEFVARTVETDNYLLNQVIQYLTNSTDFKIKKPK